MQKFHQYIPLYMVECPHMYFRQTTDHWSDDNFDSNPNLGSSYIVCDNGCSVTECNTLCGIPHSIVIPKRRFTCKFILYNTITQLIMSQVRMQCYCQVEPPVNIDSSTDQYGRYSRNSCNHAGSFVMHM